MEKSFGPYVCNRCKCEKLLFQSLKMTGQNVLIILQCTNQACGIALQVEIEIYKLFGLDETKPLA